MTFDQQTGTAFLRAPCFQYQPDFRRLFVEMRPTIGENPQASFLHPCSDFSSPHAAGRAGPPKKAEYCRRKRSGLEPSRVNT